MHIMEKPNEDMAFMQKIENKQLGQSSSKVVFQILCNYFFLDYIQISSKKEKFENVSYKDIQTRLYKDFVPIL